MKDKIKDKNGNSIKKGDKEELIVEIQKYSKIDLYHATNGLDVMLQKENRGLAIHVPEDCKSVILSIKLMGINGNENKNL